MLSTTSGRAAFPTTLILVVVMTLAAAGCSLPAGDSGAATAAASAQTAAAQANAAAIAAGGVATQVAAQATVVATTIGGIATQAAAAADRAEAARATAVAAAERATALPAVTPEPVEQATTPPVTTPPVTTPAPTGSEVALDGGIRITYQHDGRAGVALYRVDDLVVYRSLEELRTAWEERTAMLWLALIETAPQANTWRLLHAVPISSTIPITPALPVSSGPITPTGWSEYTVYAQLNIGAADVPSLVFSSPHVDESQQQQVITATHRSAFSEVPLGDSLDILPNQGLIQKLLLQEERNGGTFYTLVVIDPDPGGGANPVRRWCQKGQRARVGVCRRI